MNVSNIEIRNLTVNMKFNLANSFIKIQENSFRNQWQNVSYKINLELTKRDLEKYF